MNPKSLPISFVHMEVMFTTVQGSIVGQDDPGTVSAGGDEEGVDVGDAITYLYR